MKELLNRLQQEYPSHIVDILIRAINSEEVFKGFIKNSFVKDEDLSSIPGIEKEKNIYRYSSSYKIGKSILHEIGGIYAMDPSAIKAVELFSSTKREYILDLCAAPGGKTIAQAIINPNSFIVSNDRSKSRAHELAKNIERMKLANVGVTNVEPSFFLKNFQGFFDRVILDAPCSGSGMVRKSSSVAADFSLEKVNRLIPTQQELLNIASKLVKPGGEIDYLTCSFLKEEDEEQIENFLISNAEFSKIESQTDASIYSTDNSSLHFFPILFKGEGMFLSRLKKNGGIITNNEESFLYKIKIKNQEHIVTTKNSALLSLPYLHLGCHVYELQDFAKCEFYNEYAYFASEVPSYEVNKEEAIKFIRGEEISCPNNLTGLVKLTYLNIPFSFGKFNRGKIKNYYPKGLRKNLDD